MLYFSTGEIKMKEVILLLLILMLMFSSCLNSSDKIDKLVNKDNVPNVILNSSEDSKEDY